MTTARRAGRLDPEPRGLASFPRDGPRPDRALAADPVALADQWRLALGNLDSEVAVLLDPVAAPMWTPGSELAAAHRILTYAQTMFTVAAIRAGEHGR